MKKQIILTLSIICFSTMLFSQNVKISGTVIEEKSKAPIQDVLIIVNNEILAYTNNLGNYKLEFSTEQIAKINFSHISFQSKSFELDSLISNSTVSLLNKTNQLVEVIISGRKKSKKDILKSAMDNYKDNIRKQAYWSNTNLKQVTILNDTLPSYLEIDGNLFMLGDDKNVWNWPILVPLESRRTEELFLKLNKQNVSSKKIDELYSHVGLEMFNSTLLLNYRYFENGHPLSKKGESIYHYMLDGTSEIEDEECYVVNYKAKKPVVTIKERNFHYIRGQFYISKRDFVLKKITSLFRRTNSKNAGIDAIYTIDYKQIESGIYPKQIFYNIKSFTESSNIKLKGVLNFNNIDVTPRDNYRNSVSSNRYLFRFSEVYNNYNSSYWKDRHLTEYHLSNELNEIFKNQILENLFQNGSNHKVKGNTYELNTDEPEKEILSLMQRDLIEKTNIQTN